MSFLWLICILSLLLFCLSLSFFILREKNCKKFFHYQTNIPQKAYYFYSQATFQSLCLNYRYRDELLPQLRSICTNIPQVAIVTSTKKGLFELIPKEHPTSPFFNVFFPIALSLLKEEEAKSIIIDYTANTKISLAEEVETILELAGYHPFFIQLLGFLFFEDKMKGKIDYKRVKERFISETESHFEYYWNGLNDKERACLYKVSEGIECADETIIRKLKQKALLDENKEGKPKVFSTAFLEFVRKRFKEEDKMEEREDVEKKTKDPELKQAYVLFMDIVAIILGENPKD